MQGVERKSIENPENKYEQIVNFDFLAFLTRVFGAFILFLF